MKVWTVDEVMTATVVTALENTPYREVLDLLTGAGVSAVPVVDDFRRVLGVVSEADLLCGIELSDQEERPRLFESRRRRAERSRAAARTAGALMTSPAVTALTGTTVTAAARRMDNEGVKRLPVIDDLGRLIGIVSRGDLLKVHLRPDIDIRADVTDEILRRVLVAERDDAVDVQVVDGVVTLTGELDGLLAVQLAVRLTGQVAGVVAVVDELGFDADDSDVIGNGMPFGVA